MINIKSIFGIHAILLLSLSLNSNAFAQKQQTPRYAPKKQMNTFANPKQDLALQQNLSVGISTFPSGNIVLSGVASPNDATSWKVPYDLHCTIRYVNALAEMNVNWFVELRVRLYEDAQSLPQDHDIDNASVFTQANNIQDECPGINCLTFNQAKTFFIDSAYQKAIITASLMVRGTDDKFYSISTKTNTYLQPAPKPAP